MFGRNDFLYFFDSEDYDDLSPDEKVHIFLNCLQGSSDITKELLEELFSNYGVDNLTIVERN